METNDWIPGGSTEGSVTMRTDSAMTLRQICLIYIGERLVQLTSIQPKQDPDEEDQYRFRWPLDCYLNAGIADDVLEAVACKGRLTNASLALFRPQCARLEAVVIPDASNLTTTGLRYLRGHRIVSLTCHDLKVPISTLVANLNDVSKQNLRHLSVSRGKFNKNEFYLFVPLAQLRNLRVLDVSYTDFNTQGLELVTKDLKHLVHLDLSSTDIDDVRPLRNVAKGQLTFLNLYNVRKAPFHVLLSVVSELCGLRFLDISYDGDDLEDSGNDGARRSLVKFLENDKSLRKLVHFDMSGYQFHVASKVIHFIESRTTLKFLGLAMTPMCYDDAFTRTKRPLAITGCATKDQVLSSLQHYKNRPIFVQKALHQLFTFTSGLMFVNFESKSNALNLVLDAMEEHPHISRMQMAATACVYNLTRGENCLGISPCALRRMVRLTLTAMGNFSHNLQLQKNCLLTLCSDKVLQEVTFDRFRCAQLVLNSLCSFQDSTMNRMAVAICSILAARITTDETSLLGAIPKYMQRLLRIVEENMNTLPAEMNMNHMMLKFTLSALWNLTDESPTTCETFIKTGGLALFIKILSKPECDSTVKTKILGLINNIAEVSPLRCHLMNESLINRLRELMKDKIIEVSYFAAGVLAHMTVDGEGTWTVERILYRNVLDELEIVGEWPMPDAEMVAYRTFHPFFPLLRPCSPHQVQLWALWAMLHVCQWNADKYCPMMVRERGDAAVRFLASGIAVDSESETCVRSKVKAFAEKILSLLRAQGLEPGTTKYYFMSREQQQMVESLSWHGSFA